MKSKNHKRTRMATMAMPAAPSPEERLKWAAESFASTAMEVNPAFAKARAALVEQAKALAKRPLIPQPQGKRKKTS